MNYYEKYLKYKNKYLTLKKQLGGLTDDETIYIAFGANKASNDFLENYQEGAINNNTLHEDFEKKTLEKTLRNLNADIAQHNRKAKRTGGEMKQPIGFGLIRVEFNGSKPLAPAIIELYGERANGLNPFNCDVINEQLQKDKSSDNDGLTHVVNKNEQGENKLNYVSYSSTSIQLSDILPADNFENGVLKEDILKKIIYIADGNAKDQESRILNYLKNNLNYCTEDNEKRDTMEHNIYVLYNKLPSYFAQE